MNVFLPNLLVERGSVVATEKPRETRAGTEAETTEECCSLACSPCLVDFLYNTGPPGQDWHRPQYGHNGLGLPTSIINQ